MSRDTPPTSPDQGERRQATVLFADIAGFTALSQTLDPEDLRDLMNSCFARIEEIVKERGGEIDKWIGDCAMALFGARTALERAPFYACDAALAIRQAVGAFSLEGGAPTPLNVHIGINTGTVVAGEVGGSAKHDFTVMGSVVNVASRLQSKATDGQILVGTETRRATRREFEYSEPVELELKGIDGRVPAYFLKGYLGDPASWTQGGGRRAHNAPFVGRQTEQTSLGEFAEHLIAGRGKALALWGESGLGKTRLLADFLSSLTPHALCVHVGHAIPVGRNLSFYPFAGLLRSWMTEVLGESAAARDSQSAVFVRAVLGHEDPEIEAGISVILHATLTDRQQQSWAMMQPDAQERFVHAALARLVRSAAATRPLLLVLEDLHWADDSSLTLLEFLLPLVRHNPVGFLLIARPGYDETSERVANWAREVLGSDWEQVTLGALTPEETRRLLRFLVGSDSIPRAVAEVIIDRTAGNPLFLEEIVEDLLERGALEQTEDRVVATEELAVASIPQNIEGVILSRVDRLSPNAKAAVEAASVLGRQFEYALLTTVAGQLAVLDDALAELARAGFVTTAGASPAVAGKAARQATDTYEFRHALFQESIYQSLVKKRRRELHVACARAIETADAEDLTHRYGTLAYHYLQAEDLDSAENYLFRAGERAAAFAASREALRYFRAAYDVYARTQRGKGDPKRRALLEKQIGLALLNTGGLVESVPHLNASLKLRGERVPDTPLQLNAKMVADLLAIVIDLYLRGGALRKSRGRDDDRELFEILYNRCRAQNPTDPKRAFQDNLAAIRHLRHLDATTVPYACGIFASAGAFFAFAGLSFAVSARFLEIARKLAEAGSDVDRFQYTAMSFVKTYLAGAWSDGDTMSPQLLERGIRTGLLWDADTYLGLRAELEIKQGRFEAAEATIAAIESLQQNFGYGFSEANVLANRAYLLTERGELPEAWSAINRYYESREEDTLQLIALSTRAKIEVRMGNLDDATQTLQLAGKLVTRAQRIAPYYQSAYVSAALLLAVTGYEAAVKNRSGKARQARKNCATLIGKADRIAELVARDRVQIYSLAGRFAHARQDAKAAQSWWAKASAAAEALGAEPDRRRLREEIAERD